MVFSDTICERVDLWLKGNNPYFIHEFETSIFVIGDHQFYKGYSLLLLKRHVRDLHELKLDEYLKLQEELHIAANAVYQTYKPWKMNFQCLGNQDQHVHWHILPRYEDDPYHKSFPFTDFIKGEVDLEDYKITVEQAQNIAQEIRKNLILTTN